MLTTTDRRVQYTGNDQTKEFTFNFRVWDESQVKVYQADEDAVWSDIDITDTCEVTLNDDGTGTVKFTSAPKNGVVIAITREMPFIQEDEYINGTRFNPEEIEDRFDQDCAERQELLDGLDRAIKVPNTSTQTPEEVYETLIEGSALIQSYSNELNEIYESILQLYGEFKGEIGEVSYFANSETSWVIEGEGASSAAVDAESTVNIPDGVRYRKGMNQLHVDVDGVVVAVDKDYEEVEPEDGSEYSTQLRFKVPLHDGQRIHVHTSFLGTVDYADQLAQFEEEAKQVEEQIKEAQERVEEFNQDVDKKIEEYRRQLEEEIKKGTEEAETLVNNIIQEAYTVIEEVSQLMGDANAINELREQSFLLTQQLSQYSALPYQVCQLNACTCALSETISAYTSPQDCTCTLSANYDVNCCIGLPICYYPGTCTLHVAIDGVVLSCSDYCEVNNGNGDGNGSGQLCQIQTCVCLYCGQEIHAWTEPYWCNCINYTAPAPITSCEYEGCCYERCSSSAITVANNSCGCVLYSCFICNCGDNGGAICNQSNLFVCESEFLCNWACGENSSSEDEDDEGEGDEEEAEEEETEALEDEEEGDEEEEEEEEEEVEEQDPHGNGGAIAILADGYTYLSNSCFEGNCACNDGGALYATCGETFGSCIITCCNTADCHGGAIALTTVTCLNYNNGVLDGNCATSGSGGALCATCTCLAISGGSISNNCAGSCGGALALFDCSRVIVCNACIMNNTANYGGGIYACCGSRAYVYCSCFSGNCDCCINESENEEGEPGEPPEGEPGEPPEGEPGEPPEGEPGEPPEEPSTSLVEESQEEEEEEEDDDDEDNPFIPTGYDVYLECNSCAILCNITFGQGGEAEETGGSGEADQESELMVAEDNDDDGGGDEESENTCGGIYIGCGSCATISGTSYLYNGLICIPSDGCLIVNGCLILCGSYICYIDNCGCVNRGSQGCIDCCGSSCVCCYTPSEEDDEEEDDGDSDGEPDDGGSDGGGSSEDQDETGEQGGQEGGSQGDPDDGGSDGGGSSEDQDETGEQGSQEGGNQGDSE